jgi:hypothetical protein
VLGHSEVSGLVITIKSVSELDLYLTGSGKKLTTSDRKILDRYARHYTNTYCRTGCNECETSCPDGVAIASILRYQMYFKDYGMEKTALKSYARLEGRAEKCITCETVNCSGACPYSLDIYALLRDAHDSLSFIA